MKVAVWQLDLWLPGRSTSRRPDGRGCKRRLVKVEAEPDCLQQQNSIRHRQYQRIDQFRRRLVIQHSYCLPDMQATVPVS